MGRSRYKIHEKEYPYFITSSIIGHYPLFKSIKTVQIITDSLNFLVHRKEVLLFAYVIMPDHIHLICSGKELSKKIAEFKSFTARSIINHLKKQNELGALNHFKNSKLKHKADREFQVWTEGFHPKQIIDEKMIVQKIEYIHYNPVRAGLVKKALDWEFSSARFYEGFESAISLTNLEI